MEHTYTVIMDWMLDLGLTAGELLCFGTIYGFSQDGESAFTGSRGYLARKMTASSKRTVDNALNTLVERGLVVKTEKTLNGIKFCEYRVNLDAVANCTPSANFARGGGANSAPNNPNIDNKESLSDIAREAGIDWVEKETWELLETLSKEPKWKKKTVNALRLSIKKLVNVPEIEAREMIRRTIAGGWQGLFGLDEREKSALYGQKSPQNSYPGAGGASPRPMPKSGVMASEALVQAAMEQYHTLN